MILANQTFAGGGGIVSKAASKRRLSVQSYRQTNERTSGRIDGQTNGRTEGQTEGQTK